MTIRILAFGKMSTPFYQEAVTEYLKRIRRYEPVEILEIKESNNLTTVENTKRNTRQLLLKLHKFSDSKVIILSILGSLITSEALSSILASEQRAPNRDLVFVIGPSEGLMMEELRKYSQLSFGRITLPHQLCRVVLLEQIYRGFKILNHQSYHK